MATIEVLSEIAGLVWKTERAVGDRLAAGDEIVILESMKMEIPIEASAAGRLVRLHVAQGDVVTESQLIATLETDA